MEIAAIRSGVRWTRSARLAARQAAALRPVLASLLLLFAPAGPRASAGEPAAPADAGLPPLAFELSDGLSGELSVASGGYSFTLPASESRLALADGCSRFVLALSGGEGRGLELAAGLSSVYALAGPLDLTGLARFLLDPAGEGYRLASPGARPFSLDGSLESSRLGAAFGGDAFGAGLWVPAGESPVLAVWLNASPDRAVSFGVLAWSFGEDGPSTRSWVDAEEVAAGGPARALALQASVGRASSRAGLALGVTDALRGPEGAAARFEAAFRSGPFELEAAAAARSGAWATPTGRQGPALLFRADLSFEPSDALVLDARLVSSSESGSGSDLDLALGAEAETGAWRMALDFWREGPGRGLPLLGSEIRAIFDGGILEARASCRIRADLAELEAGLADVDSFSLRLVPSVDLKAGNSVLSAAFSLDQPLAVEAAPGLEASVAAALPFAGGSLSASLGFAVPIADAPSAAWSLRWKRRVTLRRRRSMAAFHFTERPRGGYCQPSPVPPNGTRRAEEP